jgi:hypothetical protein
MNPADLFQDLPFAGTGWNSLHASPAHSPAAFMAWEEEVLTLIL